MDFRMRSHKENKQNYNSMAEFPRHFEPLSPNGVEFAQTNRLKQIQGKLLNVMQSQRAESQANSSVFLKLEQRIDRLQHKMLGFDRDDLRISNKNQPFKDARNSAPHKYNNHTQDLAFFKESTLSDLTLHREEIRKQNIKTEQIQMRQLRVEQELRDWMNNQRLELNMKLNHNEELRGSQIGKQKKYQYQYDNIKSMVNTLEHKVQQELDSKGRGFMSLKQDFQHSLQLLREEMGREIKNDKEAFTRLVKEIKDSFQVLKDALGKDRQHVKQAIFQIQNNQQSSLNKSNRSVETLASTTTERQQKIQKKMVSMKDDWNSFKLSANQKMQDLKTLVMNIQSTVLQSLQNSKGKGKDNYGDSFEVLKEELAEWKKLSEQKNLNVFREISNAMKILRIEWRKEHDELSKDFQETSKSIKQIRQSINKRVDKELLSITQVVGEQFQTLTLELEQINDFVALSKKETEEKFTKELANVKESVSGKSAQAVKLVGQCQKKMQILQAFLKKSLKETSDGLKDQIALVQQSTKMQIQSLVTSITEDNQQWQKDLKGSIKALKQSLTQQIQSNNGSQTKQYTQSLKKMQTSIESLKKNFENGLNNERNETVKQVSKVTEQLTSLIGQWSGKLKKQRENGQNTIKQELGQIKKMSTQSISQVKQTTEELKSKTKQKIGQDQKKILQLKTFLQQSLLKASKTSEDQSGKLNKKIESLKNEFQGKLKMSNDKILLQINSKKQQQQKAKQDQLKKYAQFEKKITEASSKVKSELVVELSKANKAMQEELGKNSKKVELISNGFKKELQVQVEKERKFCSDEIAKVKGELEIKIKAKEEKNLNEINAKRDAQSKQKEEDIKTKFIETEKKTTQMLSKLKTDMLTELSKSKTLNIEELTKLKSEVEAKIKASEQVKKKKEADSKAKENEVKQKENQLKSRAIELDKKIELVKKDIQRSTSEQMNKLKVQVESKVQSYNQQIEVKVKTSGELALKAKEQQKTKFQELNKKMEEVKQDVNKKIAELKGVSLVSMKAHQEQANKAQDQKLLNIKLQLAKAISQSSLTLSKDTSQKISKVGDELKKELSLSKQAINKVQANLFSQRQKNKAVYDKMSRDILDIADSMMAVIAQIKPAVK